MVKQEKKIIFDEITLVTSNKFKKKVKCWAGMNWHKLYNFSLSKNETGKNCTYF